MKCRICPSEEAEERYDDLCHLCHFWLMQLGERDEDTFISPTHHQYRIGDETDQRNRHWRGHSGARFVIAFDNGRTVETTNLWHQGEVPERFWDQFQPNGRFLVGGRNE